MLKITRPQEKLPIAILIKRTVSFFFGLCILTIFLYAIGTYQGFMDNTQRMLLNGGLILGLILFFFSFYGLISDIWFMARGILHVIRGIRGIGTYIILGNFGLLIAAVAAFILVLTRGNIP